MASALENRRSHDGRSDLAKTPKTKLVFHSGAHQQTYEHQTTITLISPLSDLSDADRSLFKIPPEVKAWLFAITTESTIFHPPGGGQPSDVGELHVTGKGNEQQTFRVLTARTSASNPDVVLHLGHVADDLGSGQELLGATVQQLVDADKRKLFSR